MQSVKGYGAIPSGSTTNCRLWDPQPRYTLYTLYNLYRTVNYGYFAAYLVYRSLYTGCSLLGSASCAARRAAHHGSTQMVSFRRQKTVVASRSAQNVEYELEFFGALISALRATVCPVCTVVVRCSTGYWNILAPPT